MAPALHMVYLPENRNINNYEWDQTRFYEVLLVFMARLLNLLL